MSKHKKLADGIIARIKGLDIKKSFQEAIEAAFVEGAEKFDFDEEAAAANISSVESGVKKSKRRRRKKPAVRPIDADEAAIIEAEKFNHELKIKKIRDFIRTKNYPKLLEKIHENDSINLLSADDCCSLMEFSDSKGREVKKIFFDNITPKKLEELFLFAIVENRVDMLVHLLYHKAEFISTLDIGSAPAETKERRAMRKLLNLCRETKLLEPGPDSDILLRTADITEFILNFNVTTKDEMLRILVSQSGEKYNRPLSKPSPTQLPIINTSY